MEAGKKTAQVTCLILFLMTLAQLGTDVYLPSFPAIKTALLTTNTYVQLTFSVFQAGFAVSQLVYGPLSDRFGRKPFLVVGVSLYFLSCIVAAMTSSIIWLLIARTVQGFGGGACSVIPRAIMQDSFSGKALAKINVYQSMTWSLIPISAPLLGSYIQHYLGWRYNFIFLSIISMLALILVFLFKETIKEKENSLTLKKVVIHYRDIFFHTPFFANLIGAIGIVSMLAAFNVTAPLLIQDTLHLSSVQYGWSIFVVAISFLIGIFINKQLMSKDWQDSRITSVGIYLIVVATLALLICAMFKHVDIWMLLVPAMVLQLGSALVFPHCATKALQYFPSIAGKAAAVFGCSLFLGGTITSSIMSVLPVASLMPLAIVIAVITSMMVMAHIKTLSHESLT